jgi:hypothetical protein
MTILDLLARIDPSDRDALRGALASHLRPTSALGTGQDTGLVAVVEAEVRADPREHIRLDATGQATLEAAGRTFKAGRFETPRLRDLWLRAERAKEARSGGVGGKLRFFVLVGRSPVNEIGMLQATAPDGSLFQLASQFNCLEAPDQDGIVDIARYIHDGTHGPRAAWSAFPGAFVRHYAAPMRDGTRIVQQTDGPQINLLEELCADGAASVTNGYLVTPNIRRPADFARALEDRFDDIRVGLHDGIEVVLGNDWDGPVPRSPDLTIAQVLCSTVAGGHYSGLDARRPYPQDILTIIRHLQRAAHFGTLVAAAALGKSYAVLAPIGGGEFKNPAAEIWDAVLWAVDAVRPLLHRDLCVAFNARGFGVSEDALTEAAEARGGALVVLE